MANEIDITNLPETSDLFVGRQRELTFLDDAWADTTTNVVTVVAMGGTGKTALVKRWLGDVLQKDENKDVRVCAWSFYSQGTDENRLASAEPFIDAGLRSLGDPSPRDGSFRDRALRLADLLRQEKTILVLDGVEPLMHPPGSVQEGRFRDQNLHFLLKSLEAKNNGLCVVTSREHVTVVGSLGTTRTLSLERMTDDDGADFLKALKVKGTRKELVRTTREYGGHALALRLLGNFLARMHGGEIRCKDKVPLFEADQRLGRHAFRVMHAYEIWLGYGKELAVLRLLGLFDRPATSEALNALRAAPAIPDLTDLLVDLDEQDWNWSLGSLRSHGLVLPKDSNVPGSVDAHPLVREYFADVLRERLPDAWREGNLRLYEHLCRSAPDQPDTVEEMGPLFAAVVHGCRAGRQEEAFDEVYRRRIQRGNEFYSKRKLGVFGSELTALVGFFDRPWEQPSDQLSEGARAFVLNEAGLNLRALGRLGEAVQPMRVSVDLYKGQDSLNAAAGVAGNVSELSLTLGDVEDAVAFGEEGVRLADRSGDWGQRLIKRTVLGDALHQAGRRDDGAKAFAEAEALQAEHQPQYPLLYSVQGYKYCDLLLGRLPSSMNDWERRRPACSNGQTLYAETSVGSEEIPDEVDASKDEDVSRESRRDACAPSNKVERVRKACEDVLERATQTLGWVERAAQDILSIALDHLTLGRSHLGLALTFDPSPQSAPGRPLPPSNDLPKDQQRAPHADRGEMGAGRERHLRSAAEHLDEAVRGLRRAGAEEFVARGLIARATLRRVADDTAGARADLDEALGIAERGGMRLHLCDALLEDARLAVVQERPDDAWRSLGRARSLVAETGYRRRDEDVAELEAVLERMGHDEPSASGSEIKAAPSSSDVPAPSSSNVPAPSSNENAGALALWRENLAFYQEQLATAADPEIKLRLMRLIEEARRMIDELNA